VWTIAVEAQLCAAQFIFRDKNLRAYQRGVILDFSRPSKPTNNAFIEAFTIKLRSECLNAHCSCRCKMLPKSWRLGVDTTTKSDRIVRSGISPRSFWQTQPVTPAYRI
jgi:putative transposase